MFLILMWVLYFLFSVPFSVVSLSPTEFDFSKILEHPVLTSKAPESFSHA